MQVILDSSLNSLEFAGLYLLGQTAAFLAGTTNKIVATVESPDLVLSLSLIFKKAKSYIRKKPTNDLRVRIMSLGGSKKYDKMYQLRDEFLKYASVMSYIAMPSNSDLFIADPRARKNYSDFQLLKEFHVYNSGSTSDQLLFQFSGCSWLFFYEIGVGKALQELVDETVLKESAFIGFSTGSIVSCALALGIPLETFETSLARSIPTVAKKFFGPLGQMKSFWQSELEKLIPDDISGLSKNFSIPLQEYSNSKASLFSNFDSKADLINHLLACLYTPAIFEKPISIKNKIFVGASSEAVEMGDRPTITISPHANSGYISPHMVRYLEIQTILPPSESLLCVQMVNDGFHDCKRFLSKAHNSKILPARFFKPDFKTKFNVRASSD